MAQDNQEQSLERALNAGIAAVRRGERQNARRLLEAVIARDPDNELAWIWLASAVPTERERRICLEKVLQINPGNQRARDALNSMVGIGGNTGSALRDLQRSTQPEASFIDNALRYGIIMGTLFLVFMGLQLVLGNRVEVIEPTPRPTSPPASVIPTDFIFPTAPVVVVSPGSVARDATLPPTATATATIAPSATPTATSTPFPLTVFTLLYTGRNSAELTSSLYRVQGDGSNPEKLLDDVRDVSYSRNGTQIVFVRDVACDATTDAPTAPETTPTADDDGRVSEVFIASAANPADARQVTALCTADAHSPVLSPDGQQIVFVAAFNGDDEELWLLDLASGLTRQLTNNEQLDRDPDFAPDGQRIVFTSDRDSPAFSEIYVMDLRDTPDEDDSLPATALTTDPGSSYRPRWSPDGRTIVYLNDRSGDADIYLMTDRGQRNRVLLTPENSEERAPDWTPDGRLVAFISSSESGGFGLYVMDENDTDLTVLNADVEIVESFSYRPDPALLN